LYRSVLGAELTALLRFKDSPDPGMVMPGCMQASASAAPTVLVSEQAGGIAKWMEAVARP
jgi:hypothetical protein